MYLFFFFNDPATTEIYTLSLHDALPISIVVIKVVAHERTAQRQDQGFLGSETQWWQEIAFSERIAFFLDSNEGNRSEEHTSELQSHVNLVCRLLLEKKKK